MRAWFWRFGAIALCGLVFAAVPSPGGAGAQAPPERTILIDLVAPPSLEGSLQAGLWLDGIDVTDQYCSTSTAGPSDSGGPVLRCDDLPDGSDYRVGLVEPIPVGTATTVVCGDGTGTRTQAPSIPWASSDGWDCQLWASSPAIVLDSGSPLLLADDLPAPFEWVVRDPDGSVVSSNCEPDELFGHTQFWCTDLVLAGHTVGLVPPTGYRGDVLCEAVGANPVSWNGTVELTEQAPIWRCQVVSLAAPLTVDFNILDPLAPSWFDDLALVVEGPDGRDASEFCEVIDISEFEQGEIWTHTGRADCPGLPAGIYEVTFSGVPDEVEVGVIGATTSCRTEVTDVDEGGCIFEFRAARDIPPDTTSPPAPTPPAVAPTGTLPATGSPPGIVPAAAVALLIAGAALITITRRPPRSASEGDLSGTHHSDVR